MSSPLCTRDNRSVQSTRTANANSPTDGAIGNRTPPVRARLAKSLEYVKTFRPRTLTLKCRFAGLQVIRKGDLYLRTLRGVAGLSPWMRG